jgi:hypothetical protein
VKASRRLVGVVLDGRRIIFVRARGPRSSALDYYHRAAATVEAGSPWSVTEPLPITRESVGQLLHYLRDLDRSPLTAEALARVFSPQGELGPRLVGALYKRLVATSEPLVDTLFREWDRIFGIVYGQNAPRAAESAKELGSLYGVTKPDLKRLFEPAKSDALEKLGEGQRALGIATDWLRARIGPLERAPAESAS